MKRNLLLTLLVLNVFYKNESKAMPIRLLATDVICVKTEYLASFNKQLPWLAYEVIGFLISELLPAVFTEICVEFGGNQQLCNAGGKAISLLLALEPGSLRIGSTGSIEWKVSKGAKQSYVSFKTADAALSIKLKQLLLSYSESCAKDIIWKKIIDLNYNNLNIDFATNSPCHAILIQNNSGAVLLERYILTLLR